MASTAFHYQKLSKKQTFGEGGEEEACATLRSRGWLNLGRGGGGGGGGRRGRGRGRRRWWWRRWRRRPRVRIPGLRRVVGRKARAVRAAVKKVVKRFKEGGAHMGDMFAGNYMFMQVNPAPPVGCLEKSFVGGGGGGGGGGGPSAPSSRYHLPWIV